MKKKIFIVIALVITVLVGAFWMIKVKNDAKTVSDKATAVINAMMTCPNEDFYNDDMITRIGLGITTTEEEKKKIGEASKKAESNWEAALGQYFAEGYFKKFTVGGIGQKYLNDAFVNEETSSVKSIELIEKTKDCERLQVVRVAGGKEWLVNINIDYDAKGLITEVSEEEAE